MQPREKAARALRAVLAGYSALYAVLAYGLTTGAV